MKLPVHGGTGARSARVGEYDHPFSRAQKASAMYDDPRNSRPGALTGNPSNPQQPAGAGANAATAGTSDQQAAAAAAPPPGQFDLSADPVLQQVQASIARANADAGASALRAREQDLVQYGDSGLAASVLGANDPMVQAAGQNQESTLALLKRGYDQGLWNLDNTMDPSLVFSGARIKGEGQLGQGYQDRKAAAAAQIQAELGQITDAYNNALEGNQSQLDSALADAYARAVQAALTNPPASSSGDASTPAKHQPKPPKHGKKSHLSHAAGGGGRGALAS